VGEEEKITQERVEALQGEKCFGSLGNLIGETMKTHFLTAIIDIYGNVFY
jgi:hypothetical protein